jgi:ribokinase
MGDVIVLGSLNMDLVVRTEHIPRPGETVHGEDFVTIPGGKGANQAAAIARLGARVEMIGRVGGDAFGRVLRENMAGMGVGVDYVIEDAGAPSGIAMIEVDAHGENTIVVAPGANGRVTLDDVRAAADLFARARYLVMQFEIPLDTVRGAITLAREMNLPVILNPAPAYPLNADFVQGVHYLVVNETEAQTLTGLPVDSIDAACVAGDALRAMDVPVVIVTLGAQGALLVTEQGAEHVPARAVKVVDTTAAGDAFVGGLTAALLEGYTLPDAVRYATCAGTLATTVLGAQTSLPSREQVQAFYREVQS